MDKIRPEWKCSQEEEEATGGFKIGGRADKKLREWMKEDDLLEMKTHSSYSVVVRSPLVGLNVSDLN